MVYQKLTPDLPPDHPAFRTAEEAIGRARANLGEQPSIVDSETVDEINSISAPDAQAQRDYARLGELRAQRQSLNPNPGEETENYPRHAAPDNPLDVPDTLAGLTSPQEEEYAANLVQARKDVDAAFREAGAQNQPPDMPNNN